jgi:hypothetical protein
MSTGSRPVAGADAAYLLIGSDSISVGCDLHPDFTESHGFDKDRRVPATWVVSVLASHLKIHPAPPQEPPAEEPANPTATAVSQLDAFGQTVASHCRWAMAHNDGDPSSTWPVPLQLAVALALGNHLYLSGMGPGPGYTPQQALTLLFEGMPHPPSDADAWIQAIRAESRRPGGSKQSGLVLPSAYLRLEH